MVEPLVIRDAFERERDDMWRNFIQAQVEVMSRREINPLRDLCSSIYYAGMCFGLGLWVIAIVLAVKMH